MSKSNLLTCVYKNEKVTFKSYSSEFTDELYEEFELKAKKINLESKIDNLFSGRKVNFTEDLAAWHVRYRDEYNPSILNTPSNKDQESAILNLYDLCSAAKNIVTIGIGGSFEGPKMLLEMADLHDKNVNFLFITGSDPVEFYKKINKLKQRETIFIVSSKSFATVETIQMFDDAMAWSGDIEKFIAVTANRSEAEKYNIKNIIEFDQEIGGRYSIWSEISILFFWLCKNHFDDFIAGGKQADKDLERYNELKALEDKSLQLIIMQN